MNSIHRNARRALIAASALALAGCQGALFGALNLGGSPGSVRLDRGVIYDEAHRLALDLYCPAHVADAPMLVFFYGGKWTGGSRSWYRFVGESLAERGIAVAIPDYRVYPAVRFPVFVEDAARAVAWAREHARECNADPGRLFIAGHSSGAHIGALVATDARYLAAVGMKPRDLAGAIGISGPYDFLPSSDADITAAFGPPARYAESQPVNFVDGDEPPFLLLHGTTDKRVWLLNSERLAQRLEAVHVPVMLKRYEGVGHAGILIAFSKRFRGRAATLKDVVTFVK